MCALVRSRVLRSPSVWLAVRPFTSVLSLCVCACVRSRARAHRCVYTSTVVDHAVNRVIRSDKQVHHTVLLLGSYVRSLTRVHDRTSWWLLACTFRRLSSLSSWSGTRGLFARAECAYDGDSSEPLGASRNCCACAFRERFPRQHVPRSVAGEIRRNRVTGGFEACRDIGRKRKSERRTEGRQRTRRREGGSEARVRECRRDISETSGAISSDWFRRLGRRERSGSDRVCVVVVVYVHIRDIVLVILVFIVFVVAAVATACYCCRSFLTYLPTTRGGRPRVAHKRRLHAEEGKEEAVQHALEGSPIVIIGEQR